MESKLKHVKPYTMAINKQSLQVYLQTVHKHLDSKPLFPYGKDTHTGPVATAAYKSQASFVAIYGRTSIWILYTTYIRLPYPYTHSV